METPPPPGPKGAWGLSFEGHHLSLNFTVRDGALVENYCGSMPAEVASERLALIEQGSAAAAGLVHHGWDELHFAWAGGLEPGKGHSYRLEGPVPTRRTAVDCALSSGINLK